MLKKLKGALELLKNKLLRKKYTNYIDIKNNQKEISGLIKEMKNW
jgi:hypothetical protein